MRNLPSPSAAVDDALARSAANDNHRAPCCVGLARQLLMASRAVVASAAGPARTRREAFYASEHAWAVEHLNRAVTRQDFSGWSAGDERTSPCRWRLARRMLELHTLADRTAFETLLAGEIDRLWTEVAAPARPDWAA